MIRRIKSWLITIYMWIRSFKPVKNATILSAEKTVEKIVQERLSLIRFGDGEFFLINGNDIHYQIYSKLLSQCLDEIITSYSTNMVPNYLVCMPKKYFECNSFSIARNRVLVKSWVRPRFMYQERYDTNVVYGDAFLFQKGNESIYSKIWDRDDIKHILFVHNNPKYAEIFSKKYCKEVTYVRVPTKNAFESRESILNTIKKRASSADMVLISAGPCAKYLAAELSKCGIWVIDTGHCWDEPLEEL